jgi:hypothetical protein
MYSISRWLFISSDGKHNELPALGIHEKKVDRNGKCILLVMCREDCDR